MQLRCEEIARYMLENKLTVRETAAHFGISKTTVHCYVTDRLKNVNNSLYCEVRMLLDANWNDRQHRGGLACRKAYRKPACSSI